MSKTTDFLIMCKRSEDMQNELEERLDPKLMKIVTNLVKNELLLEKMCNE